MKKEEYLRPFSSYVVVLDKTNRRNEKALVGLDNFRRALNFQYLDPIVIKYKSPYEEELKKKHKEAVSKMVEYIELLADDNIEIAKYLKDELILNK